MNEDQATVVQTNTLTHFKNMARFMVIIKKQTNEPFYKGSASLKTKPSLSTQNKQHMQILLQSLKKQIIFLSLKYR